jgi:hypothetical protein
VWVHFGSCPAFHSPDPNAPGWCCPSDPEQCSCSPVLVNVEGNGFDLTNLTFGVNFDINADGFRGRIAWTTRNSDDSWLALDINGNGQIDNGTELFGNYTEQPEPQPHAEKNGFLALAEWDRTAAGGNNDGKITASDAVFTRLRLWQDFNHNGVSESAELRTLAEVGVASIDLDYMESEKTDQHGNEFRYRAKVKDIHGNQLGKLAWDVFLVNH